MQVLVQTRETVLDCIQELDSRESVRYCEDLLRLYRKHNLETEKILELEDKIKELKAINDRSAI